MIYTSLFLQFTIYWSLCDRKISWPEKRWRNMDILKIILLLMMQCFYISILFKFECKVVFFEIKISVYHVVLSLSTLLSAFFLLAQLWTIHRKSKRLLGSRVKSRVKLRKSKTVYLEETTISKVTLPNDLVNYIIKCIDSKMAIQFCLNNVIKGHTIRKSMTAEKL